MMINNPPPAIRFGKIAIIDSHIGNGKATAELLVNGEDMAVVPAPLQRVIEHRIPQTRFRLTIEPNGKASQDKRVIGQRIQSFTGCLASRYDHGSDEMELTPDDLKALAARLKTGTDSFSASNALQRAILDESNGRTRLEHTAPLTSNEPSDALLRKRARMFATRLNALV